jgi:hypothetical protein
MEQNTLMLTKKQHAILSILADGECHTFAEMMRLLRYDDEEQRSLITWVSSLRKLLRPIGQWIVTERRYNGEVGYRHVILLTKAASPLAATD